MSMTLREAISLCYWRRPWFAGRAVLNDTANLDYPDWLLRLLGVSVWNRAAEDAEPPAIVEVIRV